MIIVPYPRDVLFVRASYATIPASRFFFFPTSMRPFRGEAAQTRRSLDDLDDPFGVPDHQIESGPVASPLSFGVQNPEVPTAYPTPPAPVHSGIRAYQRIVEPTRPSPTLEALVREAEGEEAEFADSPLDAESKMIFDMTHQAIEKTLAFKDFSKLPTQGIPRGLIQMLNLFHRRGAYLQRGDLGSEYLKERQQMEERIRAAAADHSFATREAQEIFDAAVLELIELVQSPFSCGALLKLCEMRDPSVAKEAQNPNMVIEKLNQRVQL